MSDVTIDLLREIIERRISDEREISIAQFNALSALIQTLTEESAALRFRIETLETPAETATAEAAEDIISGDAEIIVDVDENGAVTTEIETDADVDAEEVMQAASEILDNEADIITDAAGNVAADVVPEPTHWLARSVRRGNE